MIPAALGLGSEYGGKGALAALISGAGTGLARGALSSARTTMGNPRLQVGALESLVRASQAGNAALQTGAKMTAATQPKLHEDEEAIQAFLSGG